MEIKASIDRLTPMRTGSGTKIDTHSFVVVEIADSTSSLPKFSQWLICMIDQQ